MEEIASSFSCLVYQISSADKIDGSISDHVSHVRFQVSGVRCHIFFLSLFLLFIRQSGQGSRWRVCYKLGLPRLVSMLPILYCVVKIYIFNKTLKKIHTFGAILEYNFYFILLYPMID